MERSWDEIPAQGNQLTGNTKTAEFQQSSHPAANNHHRQSSRHPPSRGPNRKSGTELGISPRNTTGQGSPARQASSTEHTKPRNSNDSHRPSPPDTTQMRQPPDLNRKSNADIRYSPRTTPHPHEPPLAITVSAGSESAGLGILAAPRPSPHVPVVSHSADMRPSPRPATPHRCSGTPHSSATNRPRMPLPSPRLRDHRLPADSMDHCRNDTAAHDSTGKRRNARHSPMQPHGQSGRRCLIVRRA